MKTSTTRIVDPMGRVSIPGYLRKVTGINPGDTVTVEADDKGIRISATGDRCCICGEGAADLLNVPIGPSEHKFCVNCARSICEIVNK